MTASSPGLLRALLHSQRAGHAAILVLTLVCAYAFAWRGMRFYMVPSESMEPALRRTDHIVTMRATPYARGDIVVVWDRDGREYLVKRIAGMPGDRLSVSGGALYINGAYASEPYLAEPMDYLLPGDGVGDFEVPNGRIFLLGDNRNWSEDSHMGLVTYPIEDTMGRVVFRYFPYDRAGPIRSYPLTNSRGE